MKMRRSTLTSTSELKIIGRRSGDVVANTAASRSSSIMIVEGAAASAQH